MTFPSFRRLKFLYFRAAKIVVHISIVFLLFVLIHSIWLDTNKEYVILQPFNVPEKLVESGYTGSVITSLIVSNVDSVKKALTDSLNYSSYLGNDLESYLLSTNELNNIDFEVAATKFSYKAIINFLKSYFRVNITTVQGDLVIDKNNYFINVRIVNSTNNKSKLYSHSFSKNLLLEELGKVTIMILQETNPVVYANYCYLQGRYMVCEDFLIKNLSTFDNVQKAEAYFLIGLLNKSDTTNGKYYLNKCLNLNPKHWTALNTLGNIYFDNKDSANADKYYSSAIDCNKDYATSYHNLGILFFQKGDTVKAVNKFKNCIEHNPRFYDAYAYLAYIYYYQNKKEDAKEMLMASIESNPRAFTSYSFLGRISLEEGKILKAKQYYLRAISINPYDSYANNSLAYIALQDSTVREERANREAIMYYVNASKYDNNGLVYYNLGLLQYRMRLYLKAKENLKKSIELSPDSSDSYYVMGLIYNKSRQKKLAKKYFKKALERRSIYVNEINSFLKDNNLI